MARTREQGPFSAEAVRLLGQFRWQATLIVVLATLAHWVVRGTTADLVANASWPDVDLLWTPFATLIVATFAMRVCRFGMQQSASA